MAPSDPVRGSRRSRKGSGSATNAISTRPKVFTVKFVEADFRWETHHVCVHISMRSYSVHESVRLCLRRCTRITNEHSIPSAPATAKRSPLQSCVGFGWVS